jgi:hypothetical protein
VGKLYGWLFVLELVLSASLALASWSVYAVSWPPGAAAGVLFLVFAGATGTLLPAMLQALSGPRRKVGQALAQAFGAWSMGEFLTMALITWILGKRHIAHNNAYDTLGLLIFLALMGVGATGAVFAVGRFFFVRNRELVLPRLRAIAHERAAHTPEREGLHTH